MENQQVRNGNWQVSFYFVGLVFGFVLGVISTLLVQLITG